VPESLIRWCRRRISDYVNDFLRIEVTCDVCNRKSNNVQGFLVLVISVGGASVQHTRSEKTARVSWMSEDR
jgi:hypothetical protein